MSYLQQLLFGYYPYVVLSVFALGCLVRFEYQQYTWRSGSSQLLRRRQLVWGSNLFHVGILGLFIGHFGGLLTPIAVFEWLGIGHSAKQMIAIVSGGILGAVCFLGLTLLVYRRLFDERIRKTSSAMDIAVLLLLYLQLVLGMVTLPASLQHLDGTNMIRFMEWAQHIVTFRAGAAELVSGTPWIFQVHLVLGMTIFLLFPFSRLVHIWSAPVWYVGRRYQIVRTKRLETSRPL
ncbi:MAG TPA: respiratory nitrate reductase subunit gamma [Alphaproteobacteria bacterium]|nr:respiratory nitrate reductase subunit gamma [Alphaproteobacteria bacterium]